jgi:outer membrane protein TolC
MRVILGILLLLQVLPTPGQTDKPAFSTVENAVLTGIRNNPTLTTDSAKKYLVRQIKSTWYQWLYQINRLKVLEDQLLWLGDLDRVATLRYEEGDIDLLEKASFVDALARIRALVAVADHDTERSLNQFRQLLHCNEKPAPSDSSLSMYQVIKGSGDLSLLKSLADSLAFENLQLVLDSKFAMLRYYQSYGLDHARLILQINKARLNAEETDYLEFTRSVTEAFETRMDYLNTLNEYNQTAIELEYYAY